MGLIPKQTKSEIKVVGNFALIRIFGLAFTLMLSSAIGSVAVHKYLQPVFIPFNLIVFLILSKQSPTNPRKSYWRGLASFLLFKITLKKLRWKEERAHDHEEADADPETKIQPEGD
ncbi:MAG: hypothetical protein QM689_01640 [Oscillospiraceae bacterium]